ncbi:hypothetical protein F5Y07DRAFT_375941 [Xylaria sp. FL0933]|nr:hypothetical protein F5Y07DRAFT_375941 [Xylaria sp. FL0933]
MVDRPLHCRSRSPRTNAHGSQYDRRRIDDFENSFGPVEDDPRFERDGFDYQLPGTSNTLWVAHGEEVLTSDDLVPSTSHFHDPRMQLELSTTATSYYDEQLSDGYYYSHPGSSYPVWGGPAGPCRHHMYDSLQDSMLSAASSPGDGNPEYIPDSTHRQIGPPPSQDDEHDQLQTSSTRHHSTAEATVPMNRRDRRWSIRARQGSGVHLSDADFYGNAAVLHTMNQPGKIEEQESSESSGGNTPVDRDQHFDRFMSGVDDPWSPESRYHGTVYQSPY